MALTRSLTPKIRQSTPVSAMARAPHTARGVSIIAQSGTPPHLALAASMSSAPEILGSSMASGWACAIASMSASCQAVAAELTRTTISRGEKPLSIAAAVSRARALSSDATASSRSRITTSASRVRAFSSALLLAAGTYSAVRRALYAFDKDEFALAGLVAIFAGLGVFRRMIAVVRVLQRGELDHHIAGAG